jgi:hypothetical protein
MLRSPSKAMHLVLVLTNLSKDMDAHLIRNLGDERDTDEKRLHLHFRPTIYLVTNSILMSSVLWKVTATVSSTIVRTIVSQPVHNLYVSKVTTFFAVILARRIARMLVPTKASALALVLSVAHRTFEVSKKIRMTDLPLVNPWSRILSAPVPRLSSWL